MPQEYKTKEIEKLKETLKTTKSFYLTDYRGLSVAELTELRKKLREKTATYKIVKNNFFKLALKDSGIEGLDKLLFGPLGVVFITSEDSVSPAKVIIDFEKEKKKQNLFKIIGGYAEGQILDKTGITSISTLPTKEVLLSMIMGTIQGPARGLMTCLQGPIRGIMNCLNAWVEKEGKK